MVKTLLAQVKEFKKSSILTPLFMLLEVVMETFIPLLMASIIDNGIQVEGGNIRHICKMGVFMILAAAIGLYAGKMPELHFYLDDSLDYIENIDNLLKK